MDQSIAEQFVLLAINPENGRVAIDSIHFRYSLTGALFIDYIDGEELIIKERRVVPSFRINDEAIHLLFSDRIMKSTKNRRLSYWIRRLTNKSRFVFSEMTKSLETKRLIRIEKKKFLNIFPYKRYWITENSTRDRIIELIRGILLHGKQAGKKEYMLLGIIEASGAYKLLSRERGETKLLKAKNRELLKGDVVSSEISQTIKEVQAAIVASVIAASAAAHGSH